jgi:hypothetical protein
MIVSISSQNRLVPVTPRQRLTDQLPLTRRDRILHEFPVAYRNRGQNTDSAKILEHIIYGLFFLYTWAPWPTRTDLSFAHTLDFVVEVLSAQHPFLVQGFTNGMDLPMIHRHEK